MRLDRSKDRNVLLDQNEDRNQKLNMLLDRNKNRNMLLDRNMFFWIGTKDRNMLLDRNKRSKHVFIETKIETFFIETDGNMLRKCRI